MINQRKTVKMYPYAGREGLYASNVMYLLFNIVLYCLLHIFKNEIRCAYKYNRGEQYSHSIPQHSSGISFALLEVTTLCYDRLRVVTKM